MITTICTQYLSYGQIIYVRREQGSWDLSMGVK